MTDLISDAPLGRSHALDEETARAELYGVLAQLLYAAPTPELLAALRLSVTQAPQAGAFLETSWMALVAAARNQADDQVAAEFDALFGGVGKPEVSLYASQYLTGFLNERPLVALRSDLARLGLTRSADMIETEDHIAYLCEVMRWLIAGDDAAVCNLTQQQAFFSAHIQPWVADLCEGLAAHPKARFYAAVAGLLLAFVQVETQAFDLMA